MIKTHLIISRCVSEVQAESHPVPAGLTSGAPTNPRARLPCICQALSQGPAPPRPQGASAPVAAGPQLSPAVPRPQRLGHRAPWPPVRWAPYGDESLKQEVALVAPQPPVLTLKGWHPPGPHRCGQSHLWPPHAEKWPPSGTPSRTERPAASRVQGAAAAQSVSEEGAASVPTRPAHGPGDGILPLAKPGRLLPPVSLKDGARRPRGPGSGGRLWEPASTRPAPAFHPGLSDGGGGGGSGRAEPPVDVDRVPL